MRKVGRPKKGRMAKLAAGNKLRKPRPKSLDEIIAESNVTPWTDADFERATEIGRGLFDNFAEEVRKWRDQDELLEAERWARLKLKSIPTLSPTFSIIANSAFLNRAFTIAP